MEVSEDKKERKKKQETEAPLGSRCEPSAYEPKWIEYWEKNKIFSKHPGESDDRFSMVIPPPNVTGSLHMGHALNTTLQDALLRYNHLLGRDALWVPGMDHAGIATQNVVEKRLREEGTNRHELGREKFVQRVWEWKHVYHDNIKSQLEKIGAAVDWTRERFTLDEQCSLAVRTAFKQLYDEGLIYQDQKIINWCPRCISALSDLEVEYSDEDSFFYHIKYPVKGEDYALEIATTRPETLLGDSAVAIHPDDERYKKYHGKVCILPLVNREIPIITDTYVDMTFGSGALKITPAHDPNDFVIGRAHGLPEFVMLTEDGHITADYKPYAGMDRFEARKKIVEDLKAAGLFIEQVPYTHSVGFCSRCRSAVEPYLSLQWFVRMEELAKPAIEAVKDGRTRFVPERWAAIYLDWLENIRDWCISRQLWWGHSIPVWDCAACGHRDSFIETPDKCPSCGSADFKIQNDVLDTWFSSALWPLSTLGWPKKTQDLELYYPTSVLVTGFDIIFFWVARMMFFGLKFGKDVPFRDVFIHGLVRDEKGRKMSKSIGNVIDPLEIIKEYGADAMRFTFLYVGSLGQDVNVSAERFLIGRNFCNKLWNTARFILMMAPDAPAKRLEDLDPATLNVRDRWILTRFSAVVSDSRKLMDGYDLNETVQRVYSFLWHDFCDWYIELVKRPIRENTAGEAETAKTILHHILRGVLVLLHPFIPFITEEIWSVLPGVEGSILTAGYPKFDWAADAKAVEGVGFIQEIVRGVRDVRAALKVAPSKKVAVTLLTHGDKEKAAALEAGMEFLTDLAGVESATIDKPLAEGTQAMSALAAGVEIFVPFEVEKSEEEIGRLRKKEIQLILDINKSEDKLADEKFAAKAPPAIVEKEKAKLAEWQDSLKKLRDRMQLLGAEPADGGFLRDFMRNAVAGREAVKGLIKEKGIQKARVAATIKASDGGGAVATLEAACEFMPAALGIESMSMGDAPAGDFSHSADFLGFTVVYTVTAAK